MGNNGSAAGHREDLRLDLKNLSNELGNAMTLVRRRLQKARADGDDESVLVARMLYRELSNLQYDLIQIEISEVLQEEELKSLRKSLSLAKSDLDSSLREIEDLAQSVGDVAKALGTLGKLVTRIVSLG